MITGICKEYFLFIFIQVYDEVVDRLKKAYTKIRIGDPIEPGTLYGPMHTKQGVELYLKAIEEAKELGGKVECGAKVCVCIYLTSIIKRFFFVELNYTS